MLRKATSLAFGSFTGEITAITDASDDWETPCLCLHRELRHGKNVPDNVLTLDVGVGPVGVVVGQAQFVDRELARLQHESQAGSQLGRGVVAGQHFLDRLALERELPLPLCRLHIVTAG